MTEPGPEGSGSGFESQLRRARQHPQMYPEDASNGGASMLQLGQPEVINRANR